MQRAAVQGNDKTMAAFAHCSDNSAAQIILGSVEKKKLAVKLELHSMPIEPYKLEVDLLPATDLATPLDAAKIPTTHDYTVQQLDKNVVITLPQVVENQVYRLRFTKK
jgi:hypothetical protein